MWDQKQVEMEFMELAWHSATFDEKIDEKNQQCKLGIHLQKKLLLEACLELMSDKSIIAIQEYGGCRINIFKY